MHKQRPEALMPGRDGPSGSISRSRKGVFVFIFSTTISITIICLYLHTFGLTQLQIPAPEPAHATALPCSKPVETPPVPVRAYLTPDDMARLPPLCPLPERFGAQVPACHELGFPLSTRGDLRAVLSRLSGPMGEVMLNIMSLDGSDPSSHEYHLSWLRSWLWHLNRVGLNNYLLIGLGGGSCGPVRHIGARCFESPPAIESWMAEKFQIVTDPSPGSPHKFAGIAQRNPPRVYEAIKWFYMALITGERHSVMYADQDVHFLRDPRPHWPPGWDLMGLSDYWPYSTHPGAPSPPPPPLPTPLPSLVSLEHCMAQRGTHDHNVDSVCQSTGLVFARGNARTASFLGKFWDALMTIQLHPNEQFAWNRFVSAYLRSAPADQMCRLYRDGYGTNATCGGGGGITAGRRHIMSAGQEGAYGSISDPITADLLPQGSNAHSHSSHEGGTYVREARQAPTGHMDDVGVLGWEGRVPDVSPDMVRYSQLDPLLFINEPLVDWLDLHRSLASQLGPGGAAGVAQGAGGSSHGVAAKGLYGAARVPDACYHCRCEPHGTPKYAGIVAIHMGYVFGKRKGPTMHRMGLWHGQSQAECEGLGVDA